MLYLNQGKAAYLRCDPQAPVVARMSQLGAMRAHSGSGHIERNSVLLAGTATLRVSPKFGRNYIVLVFNETVLLWPPCAVLLA